MNVRGAVRSIFVLAVLLGASVTAHGQLGCKQDAVNQCTRDCGESGQCIFGCEIGQVNDADRCGIDCNGLGDLCLNSCLRVVEAIKSCELKQSCSTPVGSRVPDGLVAASATFEVANGLINVKLKNDLADPRSAGQLLNAVSFALSSGETAASLVSTSAGSRQVRSNGSFLDFGPSPTGWALDSGFNGGFSLCVLCANADGGWPNRLLIGDPAPTGRYSSANRSIAGNRPHNPVTAGTATFVISAPGVNAGATVTGVTFYFGTGPNASVAASCAPANQ
jgi:hypothetical protein